MFGLKCSVVPLAPVGVRELTEDDRFFTFLSLKDGTKKRNWSRWSGPNIIRLINYMCYAFCFKSFIFRYLGEYVWVLGYERKLAAFLGTLLIVTYVVFVISCNDVCCALVWVCEWKKWVYDYLTNVWWSKSWMIIKKICDTSIRNSFGTVLFGRNMGLLQHINKVVSKIFKGETLLQYEVGTRSKTQAFNNLKNVRTILKQP